MVTCWYMCVCAATCLGSHAQNDAFYEVGADEHHIVLQKLVWLVCGRACDVAHNTTHSPCSTWIVPLAADQVFEADGGDLAHFTGDGVLHGYAQQVDQMAVHVGCLYNHKSDMYDACSSC